MSLVFTVLSFIVAIGVLVTVHEFGHFWVARRLGVRVLRFSVGFGRSLWSRVAADGTEYVIAAVPLGGYVKMLDEREGPVDEADAHQAFNRQSLPVRTAIVAAGPIFNFIFAIFAYWLVFTLGVSGLKSTIGSVDENSIAEASGLRAGQQIVAVDGTDTPTWVGVIQQVLGGVLKDPQVPMAVRRADAPSSPVRALTLDLGSVAIDDLTSGGFFDTIGLRPARPQFAPIVDAISPGGAAEAAGLKSGDRVLSVDGEAMESWTAWVRRIQASPGKALSVRVDRDRATRVVIVTPATKEQDGRTYGFIGASRAPDQALVDSYFVTERYGPLESFTRATDKTWEVSMLTLRMFWKMLRLEVSVENLSGPISIAQYAGDSARSGPSRFLEFLAIVSISLGILNLLPVPILDGGHLLYFAVEAVKGSPMSDQSLYVAQHLGLVLLVGLMGLAFYNDVVRVFSL
jgi:regulator of sigma E protease